MLLNPVTKSLFHHSNIWHLYLSTSGT